jgi:metacaspase-1
MAKRALLIGINRYRVPGADLRGCVNDVVDMKAALTKYHGFSSRDIAVLTDFAATKKAMQSAIQKLVGKARRGDVLLVHYSGHGSYVPDENGDETDERDEILCPADLDWRDPLTDDWLRKTIDTMRSGVSLTVVMDCCHSGSNTRALPRAGEPVSRYLPSPWAILRAESGRSRAGRGGRTVRRAASARRKRDVVSTRVPELLITGCRDTQTSADAQFGRRFNGALTYHLVAVLKSSKGKITNRELHRRTVEALCREFDQVPQLEGISSRFDAPFLSPVA